MVMIKHIEWKEVALVLLLYVIMMSVFESMQMFLKIPVRIPVGFVCGLCIPLIFVWKKSVKVRSYIASLFIFVFSCVVCGFLYDFSWDGPAYHQLAQIIFRGGWNPYWSPEQIGVYQNDIWVNAYPKSFWIFAACLYEVANNILVGKVYNILLIISSVILTYQVLYLNLLKSKGESIVFSLLIVLSPIVTNQVLTYYIDGALYMLMILFLDLTFLYVKGQESSTTGLIVVSIFGTIVLACNTKFTGPLYMVILCLMELGRVAAKKNIVALKKLFCLYLFSGLFGVLFIGYNPYITNILRHGTVGWPIMGEKHMDIVTTQVNPDFAAKNRFLKFIIANNSKSEASMRYPTLKFPGVIYPSEINSLEMSPDIRIGGFGAWYNVILIIDLICLIFLIAKRRVSVDQAIFIVGVSCSIFSNPECWWARYVPQTYLLSIMILIYFIAAINDYKKRAIVYKIFLAVIVVNFLSANIKNPTCYLGNAYREYQHIQYLKRSQIDSQAPLLVDYSGFYSKVSSELELHHIPYVYFDSSSAKVPVNYQLIYEDASTHIFAKK